MMRPTLSWSSSSTSQGRYILVDHALSRLERGLAGFLVVEGDESPSIFQGGGAPSMAGLGSVPWTASSGSRA
jgi:hypothetical protein